MKRSSALIPLSHDHHVALEVALRLRRASADDVDAAVARFDDFWRPRGERHFEIEEQVLVGALPATDPEWQRATDRMLADHTQIRALAASLTGEVAAARLVVAHTLGELLGDHVRFEERELFVLLEARVPPEQLARLGERIAAAEAA